MFLQLVSTYILKERLYDRDMLPLCIWHRSRRGD
jgi:hypothetical protein